MSGLSGSELLFYGGILVMAMAALGGIVSAAIFAVTGRRLKRKLEAEFGKKRR